MFSRNTKLSKLLIANTAHLSVAQEVVGSTTTTTSKVLILGDRPSNYQINDNVGIVRGAFYRGKQRRDNNHTESHITRYLFAYEHPASSEHHSAQRRLVLDLRLQLQITMRAFCHFGCFGYVALPFHKN